MQRFRSLIFKGFMLDVTLTAISWSVMQWDKSPSEAIRPDHFQSSYELWSLLNRLDGLNDRIRESKVDALWTSMIKRHEFYFSRKLWIRDHMGVGRSAYKKHLIYLSDQYVSANEVAAFKSAYPEMREEELEEVIRNRFDQYEKSISKYDWNELYSGSPISETRQMVMNLNILMGLYGEEWKTKGVYGLLQRFDLVARISETNRPMLVAWLVDLVWSSKQEIQFNLKSDFVYSEPLTGALIEFVLVEKHTVFALAMYERGMGLSKKMVSLAALGALEHNQHEVFQRIVNEGWRPVDGDQWYREASRSERWESYLLMVEAGVKPQSVGLGTFEFDRFAYGRLMRNQRLDIATALIIHGYYLSSEDWRALEEDEDFKNAEDVNEFIEWARRYQASNQEDVDTDQ